MTNGNEYDKPTKGFEIAGRLIIQGFIVLTICLIATIFVTLYTLEIFLDPDKNLDVKDFVIFVTLGGSSGHAFFKYFFKTKK